MNLRLPVASRPHPVRAAVVPILLAGLVVLLFRAHLVGTETFPWDFQGGYFSHALARVRDGSFLAPPLWLPWGAFGLPAHMSLQDGAWYLPQYAYAALFGYSLVDATRLQVLHVLVAALGAYALCRSLGLDRSAALVAACGYLFSGSFFSNAEHVDIVRGSALFPWLPFALHQLWRHGSARWFLLYVLVCWQFMVGAYPGIVVAGAYTCAACVAVLSIKPLAERTVRWPRLLLIGVGALCAAALASVKYLPALLDDSNIRHSVEPVALAGSRILTTLLFDYDVDFLPNDLAMRDLFLPTCVFLLAGIGLRRNRAGAIGLSAVLVGLTFMLDIPGWQSLVSHLPGARISRFPLSDFRAAFHLGICLLAANGVASLLRRELPTSSLLARALVFFIAVGALSAYGLSLGHDARAIAWSLATSTAVVAICAASRKETWTRGGGWLFAAIAMVVVLHGYQHVRTNSRAWNVERNDAIERRLYGDTLENLTSANRFDALEWRPARLLFNSLPVVSRGELIDERYQAGWVREGFSAFGYENYKFMPGLRRLYKAAQTDADPFDRVAMEWMLRRSALVLQAAPGDIAPAMLSACVQPVCASGGMDGVQVAMRQFRENGAVFDVSSPKPFFMVENEPMYAGWQALRCTGGDCKASGPAVAVNGFLRGWSMPAGNYRLVTYYRPPGWEVASVMAWTGAVVALLFAALLAYSALASGPRRGGAAA
jgi:hypothetical protein